MKKRHACGHLGRGKFCHRCGQAKELEKKAAHLADRLQPRDEHALSAWQDAAAVLSEFLPTVDYDDERQVHRLFKLEENVKKLEAKIYKNDEHKAAWRAYDDLSIRAARLKRVDGAHQPVT